jgi:hypothetical protein
MSDGVIHLSTDALVKAINDEYAVILANERNTLPKALAIGEKLVALKSRIEHGEWKPYLKEHCRQISYETAAVYMRVYNKQAEWRTAAEKNAGSAFLTIEGVLNLLAKAKPDTSTNKGSNGTSSKAAKGGVEPGNEPTPATVPPDEQLRRLELDYGDMFEALKRVYDYDDLMQLATRLAEHLKMRLVTAQPQAVSPATLSPGVVPPRPSPSVGPVVDRQS